MTDYLVRSPLDGKDYLLKADAEFGFIRTYPWPSPADLRALYDRYNNPTPIFNAFRFLSLAKDHLRLLDHLRRVCDVGCGNGELLKLFADEGHEVLGFEPGAQDVAACCKLGLPVERAFFDVSLMQSHPKQDLMILINVLEHVPEPRKFLENLGACLADETGYVMILVPNEFSPLQRLLMADGDEKPYFFAPPLHLSYFTPQTLEALVRAAGYDVVHRTTDFPIELFALGGRNYLRQPTLGRQCHQERVEFEQRLFEDRELFWRFYDALASIDVGREIILVAKKAA